MSTVTVIMATVKVETTLACLVHMTAEGFQRNLGSCSGLSLGNLPSEAPRPHVSGWSNVSTHGLQNSAKVARQIKLLLYPDKRSPIILAEMGSRY